MSKDQAIGATVLAVCLVIAIFYLATLLYPQWLSTLGVQVTPSNVQFWTIAVPVMIAFVAILSIGGWIGWTMATTPPPKPIEEITADLEKEKPSQN